MNERRAKARTRDDRQRQARRSGEQRMCVVVERRSDDARAGKLLAQVGERRLDERRVVMRACEVFVLREWSSEKRWYF